ncbi:MAG: zinc ribbon domain-containing protein, partial [Saccharofermentans sp.]|nr:zinc ribbon domain-containing protein [Saccharofermentans sp.]
MALIKCVDCGKEYSSSVRTCPGCGFTPSFRKCEDCGAIVSLKRTFCACCGAIFAEDLFPASNAEAAEYYEGLISKLDAAETEEECLEIERSFKSLDNYKNSEEMQRKANAKATYIRSCNLMDNGVSSIDYKNAIEGFERSGNYFDSTDCTASSRRIYKELKYKELDELYGKEDIDKATLKQLADGYAELGDYEESAARARELKLKLNTGKRKTLRIVITVCIILCIVIGGILLAKQLITVTFPKMHYNKAQEAEQQQNYALAVEEYEAAGEYEDAQKRLAAAQIALHYQTGDALFNSGDYQGAIAEFTAAGEYEDSQDRIELCNTAQHYANGIALIDQGEYEQAIEEFRDCRGYEDTEEQTAKANFLWGQELIEAGELNDGAKLLVLAGTDEAFSILDTTAEELVAAKDYETLDEMFAYVDGYESYHYYGVGMPAYNSGDYELAFTSLCRARDIEGVSDLIPECALATAIEYMSDGNYSQAVLCLDDIADDPTGAALLNACKAEEANELYDLPTAYELYLEVPEDLVVEGYDLQARRALYTRDAVAEAVHVCGKFDATSNDISATDKGTYYQDGWEITSLVDHQYIEIQARMNEDGTFDFKGQVEYYV